MIIQGPLTVHTSHGVASSSADALISIDATPPEKPTYSRLADQQSPPYDALPEDTNP